MSQENLIQPVEPSELSKVEGGLVWLYYAYQAASAATACGLNEACRGLVVRTVSAVADKVGEILD